MSTEQTNNDPWSQAAPTQEDPWSQGSEAATNNDWLNSEAVQETPFDIMNPFQDAVLPLDNWVESGLNWLVEHGRPVFQAIRVPIDFILSSFETALVSTPSPIMVLILFLLAWQFSNFKLGLSTLVSLVFIGLIGAWSQAMTTLALVLTSVFFCLLIGLPMGIWLARSQTAAKFVRPILDAMQTTPAFVYLVPIVMLFGIGNVPGVVVTIIFALPPVVRLTILGIQQVPEELIEAGHSFGANKKQMLYRIQLPLALPTIMAGVNQTLMLSIDGGYRLDDRRGRFGSDGVTRHRTTGHGSGRCRRFRHCDPRYFVGSHYARAWRQRRQYQTSLVPYRPYLLSAQI